MINIRNIDVINRLAKVCGIMLVNETSNSDSKTQVAEICALLDILTQDYTEKFKEHDIDYFDLRYMLETMQNTPDQIDWLWEDLIDGIKDLQCFADGELLLYRQMTQAAYTDGDLFEFEIQIEGEES